MIFRRQADTEVLPKVYYRQCDIHHNDSPPFAECICVRFAAFPKRGSCPWISQRRVPPIGALMSWRTSPGGYLVWTVIQLSDRCEDFPLIIYKPLVLCSRILAFTKSLQITVKKDGTAEAVPSKSSFSRRTLNHAARSLLPGGGYCSYTPPRSWDRPFSVPRSHPPALRSL